jgi:hypothetical protein
MTVLGGTILALLALASGPGAAPAQDAATAPDVAPAQDQALRPLDQRVEDVNPLGTSLRVVEGGLHQPGDFAQVYAVPGLPGAFMRVQGALFAVFDQSRYGPGTRSPLISANTVFYIGGPPRPDVTEPRDPPSDLLDSRLGLLVERDRVVMSSFVDERLKTDVAPLPDVDGAAPSPRRRERRPSSGAAADRSGAAPIPTIVDRTGGGLFGDPEYRARRLRALLHFAAESREVERDSA